MQNFIDNKFPAINTKSTPKIFSDTEELYHYIEEHNINEKQEFYFIIGEMIFNCAFESIYEG